MEHWISIPKIVQIEFFIVQVIMDLINMAQHIQLEEKNQNEL